MASTKNKKTFQDDSDSESDFLYSPEILRREILTRRGSPLVREREWLIPQQSTKTVKNKETGLFKHHQLFADIQDESDSEEDDLTVTDICTSFGLIQNSSDKSGRPINSTLAENAKARNLPDISVGPSVSVISVNSATSIASGPVVTDVYGDSTVDFTQSGSKIPSSKPINSTLAETGKARNLPDLSMGPSVSVITSTDDLTANFANVSSFEKPATTTRIPLSKKAKFLIEDPSSHPKHSTALPQVVELGLSQIIPQDVSCIDDETLVPRNQVDLFSEDEFESLKQQTSTSKPATPKTVRVGTDYKTKTVKMSLQSPVVVASNESDAISPYTMSTIKGVMTGEFPLQLVDGLSPSVCSFIESETELKTVKTSSPHHSKVQTTLPKVYASKGSSKKESQGFHYVPQVVDISDTGDSESESDLQSSSYFESEIASEAGTVGGKSTMDTVELDAIIHGNWSTDESFSTCARTLSSKRNRKLSSASSWTTVSGGTGSRLSSIPDSETLKPDSGATSRFSSAPPTGGFHGNGFSTPTSSKSVRNRFGLPAMKLTEVFQQEPFQNDLSMHCQETENRSLSQPMICDEQNADYDVIGVTNQASFHESPVHNTSMKSSVCPRRPPRARPASRIGPIKPARRRICEEPRIFHSQPAQPSEVCFIVSPGCPKKSRLQTLSWIARPGKDFVFANVGEENDIIEAF